MKKINWLLILQAWAMLWVVIGHSPLYEIGGGGNPLIVNYLYHIAYSFHMPLFILISGWLFYLTRLSSQKKWTWKGIMEDKLIRLGIPMVIFTAIAMIIKTVFNADMARESEISLSYFIYGLTHPFNGPLLEMWFVAVILWCFAFMPVWNWSLKTKKRTLAIMACLIVTVFIHSDTEFLAIGRFMRMAFYFYLGIVLCKYNLLERIESQILTFLILGIMIFVLGWYVKFNVTKDFGGIITAIGGIIASASISFSLNKFLPNIFVGFRNYTYQIFLMGIFFQIVVKMIYKRVDMPYTIGFVLCTLVGLYAPVLISKFIKKINYKPLLISIGLK